MIRQIEISPYDEQEGLCFELDRAREEGLYEEIVMYSIVSTLHDPMNIEAHEVQLSADDMEAFNSIFTDLSANMGPGEVGKLNFIVRFRYGYGPEMKG